MNKDYEYAKDSTRGRQPRVDPINYKPDVLVQVWCEARVLLMLNNWLVKYNRRPKFMSEIIRFVIEEVLDQLLEAGEVEKVEFNQTARDSLRAIFNRQNLNPKGRGKRNVIHNLHLDEKRKGVLQSSDHSKTNYIQPNTTINHDDRWEGVEERIAEEVQEEKEEAISKLDFDEDGIVILPDKKDIYSAEDRRKDIEKAKEAISKRLSSEESLSTSEPKQSKTSKHQSLNQALDLLKQIGKKVNPDLRPRKLEPTELDDKEQSIPNRDEKEQDSWDSVDVKDLDPK